jgi:phosphohistidine phosphatase
MRELCLVRHAKSSWKYPKLDDFERPLNKRGRKNAPFMGKILHQLKFSPDLIITSPASRAAMTARTFAFEIKYPLDRIQYLASVYESNERNLIQLLREVDDNIEKIMLVGHNPALTYLANNIGDYPISNIPTCGVYWVTLGINVWSGIKENSGKLKYFEFPKKHT